MPPRLTPAELAALARKRGFAAQRLGAPDLAAAAARREGFAARRLPGAAPPAAGPSALGRLGRGLGLAGLASMSKPIPPLDAPEITPDMLAILAGLNKGQADAGPIQEGLPPIQDGPPSIQQSLAALSQAGGPSGPPIDAAPPPPPAAAAAPPADIPATSMPPTMMDALILADQQKRPLAQNLLTSIAGRLPIGRGGPGPAAAPAAAAPVEPPVEPGAMSPLDLPPPDVTIPRFEGPPSGGGPTPRRPNLFQRLNTPQMNLSLQRLTEGLAGLGGADVTAIDPRLLEARPATQADVDFYAQQGITIPLGYDLGKSGLTLPAMLAHERGKEGLNLRRQGLEQQAEQYSEGEERRRTTALRISEKSGLTLGDARTTINIVKRVKDAYTRGQGSVGPLAAQVNMLFAKGGIESADFADARALLNQAVSGHLKRLSGAQATEAEYKRIAAQMGNLYQPGDTFQRLMDRFLESVQIDASNAVRALGDTGRDVSGFSDLLLENQGQAPKKLRLRSNAPAEAIQAARDDGYEVELVD